MGNIYSFHIAHRGPNVSIVSSAKLYNQEQDLAPTPSHPAPYTHPLLQIASIAK
jgi:hypothetical protein